MDVAAAVAVKHGAVSALVVGGVGSAVWSYSHSLLLTVTGTTAVGVIAFAHYLSLPVEEKA